MMRKKKLNENHFENMFKNFGIKLAYETKETIKNQFENPTNKTEDSSKFGYMKIINMDLMGNSSAKSEGHQNMLR